MHTVSPWYHEVPSEERAYKMALDGKQFKGRWRASDNELSEWLQDFAARGNASDVLRLALYRLSGIPIPDDLQLLAAAFPEEEQGGHVDNGDFSVAIQAIAENTAAVRDMAQAVTSGQGVKSRDPTPPSFLPEMRTESNTDVSSGLDMSRPRPRPAARRSPVSVPDVEPDAVSDADLIALGKLMSQSIRNAEPGRVAN